MNPKTQEVLNMLKRMKELQIDTLKVNGNIWDCDMASLPTGVIAYGSKIEKALDDYFTVPETIQSHGRTYKLVEE